MTFPEIRHVVNSASQTSDAATYRYELPRSGALHTILARFSMTNGATDGHGVSILDVVDEIRVIADGHKTLFHLSPHEVEKWHEAFMGKGLELVQDETAAAVQSGLFPIMFGRSPYDPEMYLPLDRFERVELEVDYSPTIAAAAGFATGTFTVDLVLLITTGGGGLPYQGSLITRQIVEFTSVAAGDEVVEIHRANKLRAVGVYAYEAGVADGTDITRIVLDVDSGQLSLFAADWLEAISLNRELFGALITHGMMAFWQDNDTVDLRLSTPKRYGLEVTAPVSIAADTFYLRYIDAIAGDRLTLDASMGDITAGAEDLTADATDREDYVWVEGLSPSYFVAVPWTYLDIPEGYLTTTDYSKIELTLTQGGAGATVRVATQELQVF